MSTETTIEIRPHDVFRFRYTETNDHWAWSPYHCFDGTLKAVQREDGSIILRDTYWGDSGMSRSFTPDDALAKGTLKFICNLDEVEKIRKEEIVYFDDDDLFILYCHSGYRNEYYVKRGAKRSKAKMLSALDEKEREAKSEIARMEFWLEQIAKDRAEIESGNLNIYI